MKKVLKTAGLIMLIAGDVAGLIISICFHIVPLIVLHVLITAGVIGIEVWGVTIGWKQPDGTYLKKTLSQMFWIWGQDVPVWAYLWIGSFLFAMLGLGIHLGAF